MKYNSIILALALSTSAMTVSAIEIPKSLSDQVKQTAKTETEATKSNALVSYAAKQLGLSEQVVSSGLGSLFKVAKDNLSKDNFAMLDTAIPDINSYINKAPNISMSSLSSLLGSNEVSKKADSANYLDSAFKKLGIPKESLPSMVSTVTGYLEKGGYGDAASMLKKGLNFL